jgi:hypothetical protein
MKTLLIVWHSATGAARAMASAAAEAASGEPGIDVRRLAASDAGADDLLRADGYIFAAPENLGALSGGMKDFFDRTYYAALDRLNGRPYRAMIAAGSDGSNAARQLQRIVTGWRLRAVAAPLIVCTHAQAPEAVLAAKTLTAADLDPCRQTGAALAAGLAAGIF